MATAKTYFLVNDTRYDNHFGGLAVIRNLHAAMARRGWQCTGSLPVSSQPSALSRHAAAIAAAERIIINGEGSLHHNSRNTRRLLAIVERLAGRRPLILINTVWQDNDPARWSPLLRDFQAVYARDRRSQAQLARLGIAAGYAPDLTFYHYPVFPDPARSNFLVTDSVDRGWTREAWRKLHREKEISLLTLFTASPRYRRGPADWGKAVKHRLYPLLFQRCRVPVPPRYRLIPGAENDPEVFQSRIAGSRAICAARYHALCFAIQQDTPFVAVPSNSHKVEALLEDVGLCDHPCRASIADLSSLRVKLEQAASAYPEIKTRIQQFRETAKSLIHALFDDITSSP